MGVLERYPELNFSAHAELRSDRLASTDPADLVGIVVRLHEKRVRIHKSYDDAFHQLLELHGPCSGNNFADDHKQVVNAARKRFKELSSAGNAAAKSLEASATAQTPMVDDSAIAIAIDSGLSLVRSLQN